MTNHSDPLVSLIVATSGTRPNELRLLLESARSQQRSSWEILVIDQSNGLLDGMLAEYPEVVHVRSDVRGLSRNRNIGIARASGSIIAFPDDDCVLPPDYTENVIALASRFTGNTLFGYGNVLTLEDRRPFHELYDVGSMQRPTIFNCFKLPSVGLVFDRRAFARVGTFDEDFGVGGAYGAAEELDILIRMIAAGIDGLYASQLEILHPARPRAAVSIERHRSYSTALGALARKHWQYTKNWRFLLVFLYSVTRSLGGILLSPVLRDGLLAVYSTNFAAKCRGFWIYRGTASSARLAGGRSGQDT